MRPWCGVHQFNIYFDGGCKPTNPGNTYGSYEIDCQNLQFNARASRSEYGWGTNNTAEYSALLAALRRLTHEVRHGFLFGKGICPQGMTLRIFTDSRILQGQLSGNYKTKVLHLREMADEARALLKQFGHWKLKWKPRRQNVARFGH